MLAGCTQPSATAAPSTSRINTPSAWSKPQHDAVHRKGRTPSCGQLVAKECREHQRRRSSSRGTRRWYPDRVLSRVRPESRGLARAGAAFLAPLTIAYSRRGYPPSAIPEREEAYSFAPSVADLEQLVHDVSASPAHI